MNNLNTTCILSRCAALKIHQRQSCAKCPIITHSAAPKLLSTDLSEERNRPIRRKAAYQTPKYIRLTKKNYGKKCLTEKKNVEIFFYFHTCIWRRGAFGRTRGGVFGPTGEKVKIFHQRVMDFHEMPILALLHL